MADGHYRDQDGQRIFADSLKVVGGVNNHSQVESEIEAGDDEEEDREEKNARAEKEMKRREAKKKAADKRN